MAVTQDSVQSLYIAYYGRPADPAGLNYWTGRANAEGLDAVVNAFGNSTEATNLYGNLTIQARVNNLYQNMFGRNADVEGLNFYTGKVLDGTYTLATLAKHILDGVNPNVPASKADGDTLAKKLAAANAFTTDLNTSVDKILKYDDATEVTQGVSFLAGITSATTDAEITSKVTTATGALVGTSNGQTFTLTNGTDTATANVFEAPLVYTPGGNDRINSLQDEDTLTGIGTNTKLNVTLGADNDASSNSIMPTLVNIDEINVSVSSNAVGLDLQDATGTETVNITRVGGNAATVINMDADVVNLSVKNTVADADVTLTYRNSELAGTQTIAVTLDNANIDDMVLGGPTAGSTQQVETINLTVASDSYINDLDLRQDGDNTTGQTLNIVANGSLIIGEDTDGDGNVIEHANGLVEIAGLTAINVSGAGNVTLGEVGSGNDFVLNGATATGNIAANVTNAAGDDLSSFTTGTGNDTLIATAGLSADIDTNAGDDTVTITGDLVNTENAAGVDTAASITTDEGTDTVTVTGTIQVNTSISAGAGNDTVTVGGDVNAAVVGNTDSDIDGVVNAGEGDDTLIFGIASAQTTTAAAALEAAPVLAGDIAGGAGTDSMTITAEDNVTANAATLAVTGVETLNLVARFATTDDGANNNLANSTADTTADFTVDLARFDADLAAITIDNQDHITLAQNGFDADTTGDVIAVTLNNVVGEAISITSVETALNATNTGAIVDELGAAVTYDVALTLNQATNAVATDVQTLALTGDNNFDVSIDDNGADQIEELTLNVTGAGDHGIDLSDDFENKLTVAGAGTGELTIINVQANEVNTAAHTGNVWIDIDEDSVHTITTGAGNDVIDLLDDTVATTDAIDLGNGTDRIIVDTILGDFATANSSDDEVFEGFVSIEEVELRANADLVMNEDAFATGVTRVIVDATSTVESGIRLGSDFDRALRVDVEADANMDMENDANVDLDVRVAAGADANTTDVDFTDAGINNTVALTVTLVDTADNTVDIAVGGDNLDLTVADGSIDSITLVEGTGAANGDTDADGVFDAGEADNDRIVVDVSDTWATGGSLTIDASAIDNFDANSAVVGFDSLTTGGATINGVGELDAELTIRGTANNDTITGGDEADTLTGNGGNDTFVYSFLNANDSTSQSADTITDFNAGDVITVAVGTLAAGAVFQVTHATVASLAEGDNSLDGANGTERLGDSFFSTDTNQFVIDVDGNGDVQDGVDLVINVAGFTASQVQYTVTADVGGSTITTGAGNDTINGDAGADLVTGGAGADTYTLAAGANVVTIGNTDSGITVATADTVADFTAATYAFKMGDVGDATANTGNYVEVADADYNGDFTAILAALNTAAATLANTSAATELYVFAQDTDAAALRGYIGNDVDGDGTIDQVIVLTGNIGAANISAADFV